MRNQLSKHTLKLNLWTPWILEWESIHFT